MSSTIIQGLFALCIFLAACEDGWRLRISNGFPLFLICLFMVAAGLQGFRIDWLDHLGGAMLTFAVGLFVFARGILGGGDIKLWIAMSLWFGVGKLVPFTLAVVLTGGVLALVLITVRRALPLLADGELRVPLLQRRGPIPYGIALGAGGLLMLPTLLPL